MKIALRYFLACIITYMCLALCLPFGKTALAQYTIIPQPAVQQAQKGFFVLNENTTIQYYGFNTPQLAKMLQETIEQRYGLRLTIKKGKTQLAKNAIILLTGETDTLWENEAYELDVKPQHIIITADGNKGRFYAIQTLLQMLGHGKNVFFQLPCVHIEDKPYLGYRGMHLDVSRHFFTVDEVKRYINYLAMYKFNYLHLHLTDDQGWRIEIKKYPALTAVGSYRPGTQWSKNTSAARHDGKPISGFYTQQQIKELVSYARERYITIVPEIDIPGHSLAALAAYPGLGCKGQGYQVATAFGIYHDVLCAGKPEVRTFIKDVLSEIAEIFPGPYLHLGGDEVPTDTWRQCNYCQSLIKKLNLSGESALMHHLVEEMADFVAQKGKTAIGWDEVIDTGLPNQMVIMSWRGQDGGIKAAKAGLFTIMTPRAHCYFDYKQLQNEDSLTDAHYLPVSQVYAFEPIPKTLNAKEKTFILGGQGNVWTEYINNFKKLEYQLFPRIAALSETLWTEPAQKNLTQFQAKLPKHLLWLNFLGINYCARVE